MPRFSGRKLFTQEIFSRHVNEMRSLLQVLELRESFEDSETRPKMDMYETVHHVVIECDLPGVMPDDISLKLSGMTLLLEASKPREQQVGSFICVERQYGQFRHAVHVPGNVDLNSIEAEYRRGVLRVIFRKCSDRVITVKIK